MRTKLLLLIPLVLLVPAGHALAQTNGSQPPGPPPTNGGVITNPAQPSESPPSSPAPSESPTTGESPTPDESVAPTVLEEEEPPEDQVSGTRPPTTPSQGAFSLPFTGASVYILLLLGGGAILLGLMILGIRSKRSSG